MNPIFDLLRSCLVWYTPEYFLTPLACVYFMALAIAFFCAGNLKYTRILREYRLSSWLVLVKGSAPECLHDNESCDPVFRGKLLGMGSISGLPSYSTERISTEDPWTQGFSLALRGPCASMHT